MLAMAKAKKRSKAKAEEPRRNVLSIRGTDDWRDWIHALADHCRLKSGDLIDQALIEMAQRRGFDVPPPKR
ncbi:MAG TPA: hypothetical protein VG406_23670 [Isosphaeraceae bacterium]|jgi:hypothetical protein|nr:hypothetical protein [Isosphaeraceae bacterium]